MTATWRQVTRQQINSYSDSEFHPAALVVLCHTGLPKQSNQIVLFPSPRKLKGIPALQSFHIHSWHLVLQKNLELQHKKPCGRQSMYLGLFIDMNSNYNKWLVQGHTDGEKQNQKGFFTSLEEIQELEDWRTPRLNFSWFL